ncbi:hypothetical protein ASF59_09785 [Methylobacterium sp. Leaf121]|nr:hypothetical protein ASF59_09785 [Methylobacterium sp. Leaf121]
MHGRGLSEADGTPLFMGAPTGSLSTDRARALAAAAAINTATGTPDHEAAPLPVLRPLTADVIRAASDPLDPEHLIAVARTARIAPRGQQSEAAE